MHKFLLLAAAATSFTTFSAQAQYILAGSTANARYVDLAPDKVLRGQRPGTLSQTDSLDIDGDGRFDVWLAAEVTAVYFPGNVGAYIQPMHDDAAVYMPARSPKVHAFSATDTIQLRGPDMSSYPFNVWANRSTMYYNPFLCYSSFDPAGGSNSGEWLDPLDYYVGLRLRSGNLWRYGWLRLQVQWSYNFITIVAKDYALDNKVLATATPIPQGWQVYPVPAHDWLSIDLPPTANLCQLRLLDVCGRPVLTQEQPAAGAQFDLRAVPAGTYLLHGQLADGRQLTRRIVKQ
jgi:hypothetical protein